jgi:DNA-binding transcriptional ArsR family regulator
MRQLLMITKAMSDASRLRILCALLREPELCVCQIHELLRLAPSTASKHLSLLTAAGLIESRKEGRWVYYRLARPDETRPAATEALEWLARHAQGELAPTIREDKARLEEILRLPPEQLSQAQARRAAARCC